MSNLGPSRWHGGNFEHVQNFRSATAGWANPQWDRRGTAITAAAPPWPPWYRTRITVARTSITAVHPQYNRRAIAKKGTGDPAVIPWRLYCGATTVLPPQWPRSAAANTAVMPPMIAVAPPSNVSGNHMGSPCPQWQRCGSAAPRRRKMCDE